MSSRKQPKYRGPSRPVDPRYAPGATRRQGIDTFGLVLIGVSTAAVLLIILYIAVTQGGGTTTGTTAGTGTGTQPQVPTISAQEALPQVTTGAARIIDVRLSAQYDAEHIQGATSLPYDQIKARAAEIPRQGDVILYCQWQNDEESVGSAQYLISQGYTNVKVLKGGIDAWKNAGGSTE